MPPVCRNYRVAVLLSAYGDSVFFEKQIDSLKSSLTINDILIVVDDGSGQVNWDAVSEWPFHYLFWSRIQGLGSARSFWELSVDLPVSADYVCWSDQDDVWFPEKLTRQLATLATKPSAWSCVHGWRTLRQDQRGDWCIVAEHAPLKARSAAHYCFETPAPGMTLCMTENGRKLLCSFSPEFATRLLSVIPHDRLACAIFGMHDRMLVMSEALVEYRQHQANQIGAPDETGIRRLFKRLRRIPAMIQTIDAGFALFQKLSKDRSQEGVVLPPLQKQPLRDRRWEGLVLHIYVVGLQVCDRLRRRRASDGHF